MNDLKSEFVAYLRSVYSGEPAPMAMSSLPPLNVGPNFPTFKQSSLNEGLGMMAGMGGGIQPGMGLQAAFGMPMGLGGGSRMGSPMAGQGRAVGDMVLQGR